MERDVKQWKDAIRYYLLNEKERNDKALKLHKFLKDVCGRDNFDSGIQKSWTYANQIISQVFDWMA